MIDKIRRLFKKEELNGLDLDDEKYVFVPVNEQLKRKIIELEGLGEKLGTIKMAPMMGIFT
ncbi:hypothetical protein ACQKKK_10930 [Peribacillus sp. NPDC006672]|uniref:hypothetical protein n=1 Tax=Peribacillus sp. NPDC006672 TaxID=3390606 RepID=UPI003CFBDC06